MDSDVTGTAAAELLSDMEKSPSLSALRPSLGLVDPANVATCQAIVLLGLAVLLTLLGIQIVHRLKSKIIGESAVALVVGMCTGALLFSDIWPLFGFTRPLTHRVIAMDNKVFFNVLIPPIIFNAGFSFKKKLFFKNLVTISILGLVGSISLATFLMVTLAPTLKHIGIASLTPARNISSLTPTSSNSSSPPGLALNRHGPTIASSLTPVNTTISESSEQEMRFQPDPVFFNITADVANSRVGAAEPQQPYWNLESEAPGSQQAPWTAYVAANVPGQEDGVSTYIRNALRLGAIFSSTDALTVLQLLGPAGQPVLHSLMFGEGVLNTPTSIVLLKSVEDVREKIDFDVGVGCAREFLRLCLGSLGLGVACGLVSALLTKYLFSTGHHDTDREAVLMAVVAMLAYGLAEISLLSGIFTVFFCGITMSHYTWHSISPSARVIAVHKFRIFSNVAEIFMFIYAGLDISGTFITPNVYRNADLVHQAVVVALILLGLVMAGRAIVVVLTVLLVNLWRSYTITLQEAFILWWGGLVKGSITMALVYTFFYHDQHVSFPDEVILLASVIVIVVLSVAVSSTSRPLLAQLQRQQQQEQSRLTMLSSLNDDFTSVQSAAVLPSALHKLWRRFDKRIMQPVFGGRDARMPRQFHSVAELSQSLMEANNINRAAPGASELYNTTLNNNGVDDSSDTVTSPSSIVTVDFERGLSTPLSPQSPLDDLARAMSPPTMQKSPSMEALENEVQAAHLATGCVLDFSATGSRECSPQRRQRSRQHSADSMTSMTSIFQRVFPPANGAGRRVQNLRRSHSNSVPASPPKPSHLTRSSHLDNAFPTLPPLYSTDILDNLVRSQSLFSSSGGFTPTVFSPTRVEMLASAAPPPPPPATTTYSGISQAPIPFLPLKLPTPLSKLPAHSRTPSGEATPTLASFERGQSSEPLPQHPTADAELRSAGKALNDNHKRDILEWNLPQAEVLQSIVQSMRCVSPEQAGSEVLYDSDSGVLHQHRNDPLVSDREGSESGSLDSPCISNLPAPYQPPESCYGEEASTSGYPADIMGQISLNSADMEMDMVPWDMYGDEGLQAVAAATRAAAQRALNPLDHEAREA